MLAWPAGMFVCVTQRCGDAECEKCCIFSLKKYENGFKKDLDWFWYC